MGGFNQTVANLANFGTVQFNAIGANLTIPGNLTGAGTFVMDTNVAAGIGDHITVLGTSAGNHVLRILNAGGSPADPRQTLEVVATPDGAAQFSVPGGTVDVGIYAYALLTGDGSAGRPVPTNWYLVNLQTASETARAIINTAAVLSTTWFTQLDNLHRRM